MKSSPLLRAGMAAAMYLLLIWGYLSLSSPQWYAVFTAVVMSVMLLFWISETAEDCQEGFVQADARTSAESEDSADSLDIPSVSASMQKLDTLKSDLKQQYAQFGRDQCALNGKSLGYWHRNGDATGPGK